ncbi:MAG: zf-HC2 domain-containing protein [Eubacterium sp.]|nr:zf-HC2 domain-containing protein [Eubacterium sp.]
MSKNLSCEIIRDLLPSYVDNILSDASVQAVEEHIRECEACAKILADMGLPEETVQEKLRQDREINYLKKVKRRHRLVVCCILAVVVLLAVPAVEFIRVVYFGQILLNMDYDVTVAGDQVAIKGEVLEGHTVKESSFKENNGILNIQIICVPSAFFRPQKDVDEVYRPKGDIQKIYINGDLIWEKEAGTNLAP